MATTTLTHTALPPMTSLPLLPTHSTRPPTTCPHLAAWCQANLESAVERLEGAMRADYGLADGVIAKGTLPPSCSTCQTTPLRPALCLACGLSSCLSPGEPSHALEHSKKQHHQLAWDFRARGVYCFACEGYVRHAAIERHALAERIASREAAANDGDGQRATKRKRVSMQKWELTTPIQSAPAPSALAVRGIRNLGNSCYMSVILQTFLCNPFLRTYFLSDRHNRLICAKTLQGEPCLSCELDLLFSEQYSSDLAPLAPTRFLHSFWQSSAEAAGYAQQDAHEFLISALNLLHSSSPSHHDSPTLGPCRCPIHSTFAGELRSKVTCGRCHHQSETAEPFLDLSLDLKDRATGLAGKTLGDCLKSFTTPEQLPSTYSCAACGDGVPSASKRLSLKTLPPVLCIQFKRFEITNQAQKLDTPIRYPLKLDMSPFLTNHLEYPASYKPSIAHRYNLAAVVAHEGTLSQGHYTAYVRGVDDFYAIDDEKVRRVRIAEVLAAKAYLLVYSRI
ncbi:Ubiquitin carboxyl-terminal hydrolase [Rhodotorula toruloides]|uniref:Ubiquitin carboxyl-terminal hydrolase n=1 Tax=Rhodotorula toruloides TaxID=5286 RepID=A0A0K3CB47_RHOTO|nr:Ubiquitin carboxyl-terminal hydrolase [Rhodotorula toruloides]PRQ75908.1 hypothetical protein AAT19DRAFT_12930 [Rhodotorula toruloides]